MKKPMCVLAGLVCACTLAYSQDDVQKATAEAAAALSRTPEAEQEEEQPRYWTSSSQFDLGMSNTSLWNWAAGGYNTLAANGGLDAKADYAKDLLSWKNRLQLQYGFFWSADKKNVSHSRLQTPASGTTPHRSTSARSSPTVTTPTPSTKRPRHGAVPSSQASSPPHTRT